MSPTCYCSVTSFVFSSAIFIILQLQITSLVEAKPLLHFICNAGEVLESYPPNGIFSRNLDAVFSDLYRKAGNEKYNGFVSSIVGEGNDRSFGQALCRSDASSTICQRCILNATITIREMCGFSKSAIVWHTRCSVKYSSHDFIRKLDYKNNFSMVNDKILTESPTFMNTATSFLEQLSMNAIANTKMLHAAGELRLCEYLKLHGMAHCTRDLSNRDCFHCLKTAIAELPGGNRQGARMIFWSCMVRFEIYPFLGNHTSK